MPQVVDAVDVPVSAAGGIAGARGIAAAFMLGADGVQIGSSDFSPLWSGQAGPLSRAMPAGELAVALAEEPLSTAESRRNIVWPRERYVPCLSCLRSSLSAEVMMPVGTAMTPSAMISMTIVNARPPGVTG